MTANLFIENLISRLLSPSGSAIHADDGTFRLLPLACRRMGCRQSTGTDSESHGRFGLTDGENK